MTQNTILSSSRVRLGLLLIVIGGLFAVDAWYNLSIMYRLLWPLLITLLGIGFLGLFLRRSGRESAYLGVSVFLICFSGLALYLNFTTWGGLSHLWTLFIAFTGLALTATGFKGKHRRYRLLFGLILISTAAVFHFVFFIDPRLWWTTFILAGISILIVERVT